MLLVSVVLILSLVLYYDFLFYEIPNRIPVAILTLYGLKWALLGIGFNAYLFGATFSLVMIVTVLLVYLNVMGEGDFKLLIALTPWAFELHYPMFLFYMTIAGALIAILYLIPAVLRLLTKLRWVLIAYTAPRVTYQDFITFGCISSPDEKEPKKYGIPYGVALFVGFLIVSLKYGVK